jgi:hypothetical protein
MLYLWSWEVSKVLKKNCLGAVDPAPDQYAWGSISPGLAVLGDIVTEG